MGSSPVVDELITKLKSSIFSTIDTQNVTKALLDSEKRLKNQNLDLIKKTQVLEMENKKFSDLLKKKDKRIEGLKKKNEELKDEMKEMVEENEGLKNKVGEMKKVNGECLRKARRVYEKRVLALEKLGKELMDSADFPGKQKDGVAGCAAETNIPQMSNEKRESKQGTDDKFPDTIRIDDDDEDGDNDEDDLKYVPSSKRQRGSCEIKREYDSDDDRFISILRRKPVTKEIPSECNNDHVNKISTGTTITTMPEIQTGIQQITSHSVSPFLDSGSDDGEIKEANETILDKQKERWESADMRIESESSRKQMSSEKGESQERTNHKYPDIVQIDDDEDENEIDLKDASSLKRKRSSSNVKVEDYSDDERCISALRRKPVSKELQSESNNDLVNIIPTGRQPITSATPFLYSGKSDDVKVEEAYEPIIEKHTDRWETEAEMIIEFSKSSELCMNAVCALHRQNIYVGAYLLPRFNKLAEWLIDGDPERKLKKTPSELDRFELDQCRMFAVNYSVELFRVYQQNADRFFPPRS